MYFPGPQVSVRMKLYQLIWIARRVDHRLQATIRALRDRGIPQIVMRQRRSEHCARLHDAGLPVREIALDRLRVAPAAGCMQRQVPWTDKPIVHAVGLPALAVALALSREVEIAIVGEFDGCPPGWRDKLRHSSYGDRRVARILVREPQHLATLLPSINTASQSDTIELIHHGIRLDWYESPKRQPAGQDGIPKAISIAASLEVLSHREIATLLRAVSWLPDECTVSLRLFGNDRQCRQAARSMRSYPPAVTGRTEMVVDTQDPSAVWAGCAASVHSLRHPEAGKRLIDAMASGATPIVCSTQAIQQVRDGQSGLITRPDNPFSLSLAIQYLSNDLAALAEMGTNARNFVAREYGLERTVSALARLYESLAAKGFPQHSVSITAEAETAGTRNS
jgi:glycosyltransferase involved in cell wall biosynthesis